MINKEKLLITGGKGVIGRKFPYGIKIGREDGDLCNPEAVVSIFEKYEPEAVLHLAAMKNKWKCEDYPYDAYMNNTVATLYIAEECRKRNIPLIFTSSFYVFDGRSTHPYKENNIPNPLNVYGKTKFMGELIVHDLVKNSAIIRLGLVYGKEVEDSFVFKVAGRIIKGEDIQEYQQRFSMSEIGNVINGISLIIEKGLYGVFHLVEKGGPSYYEVAKYISQILNPSVRVIAKTDKKNDNYGISRGGFEVLEPSSVFSPCDWKEPMQIYLESFRGMQM